MTHVQLIVPRFLISLREAANVTGIHMQINIMLFLPKASRASEPLVIVHLVSNAKTFKYNLKKKNKKKKKTTCKYTRTQTRITQELHQYTLFYEYCNLFRFNKISEK